jgi:NitT/TauT family transport system permease protein
VTRATGTAIPTDQAAAVPPDEEQSRAALTSIMQATRPSWWKRRERVLLPTAALIVILACWEAAGQLGLINPLYFAYPSQILPAFGDWAENGMAADLAASGKAFGIGLSLALVGVPIGVVVGSFKKLDLALDPIINALYATPMVALTPLFVIIFGLGLPATSAVVALMAVFPLLILTIEGVKTVDKSLLRATRSFGANQREVYRDVMLPSIVPFIVSGLRLAIGRGIIGVVIGEFIGAVAGVGFRIRADAGVFNTPRYLAGILVLVAVSVALNVALRRLERTLSPWRFVREGS